MREAGAFSGSSPCPDTRWCSPPARQTTERNCSHRSSPCRRCTTPSRRERRRGSSAWRRQCLGHRYRPRSRRRGGRCRTERAHSPRALRGHCTTPPEVRGTPQPRPMAARRQERKRSGAQFTSTAGSERGSLLLRLIEDGFYTNMWQSHSGLGQNIFYKDRKK